MDQKKTESFPHTSWSDMQPVPVAKVAEQYGTEVDALESELQRLGVPVHDFMDQRVFYFRDLYSAHSQPRASSGRVERTEHLDRVLELLRDNGCTIEDQPRGKGRPSDIFVVHNAEDLSKSIKLRVQVCSKIQSGNAIHFNIPPTSWKQGIDWYWLVAPPFRPRLDFLLSSDDVGREFGPALDKKKLVTKRIKAEGFEYLNREHRLTDLLLALDIGHTMKMKAQRKAAREKTSKKR